MYTQKMLLIALTEYLLKVMQDHEVNLRKIQAIDKGKQSSCHLFHCQTRLVRATVSKGPRCCIRVGSSQPRGRSGGQQLERARLLLFSSPVRESCRQCCPAGLQKTMNVNRTTQYQVGSLFYSLSHSEPLACIFLLKEVRNPERDSSHPFRSLRLLVYLRRQKTTTNQRLGIKQLRVCRSMRSDLIATANRSHDQNYLLILHSLLVSHEVWSSSIPIRVMVWMKYQYKKISAN